MYSQSSGEKRSCENDRNEAAIRNYGAEKRDEHEIIAYIYNAQCTHTHSSTHSEWLLCITCLLCGECVCVSYHHNYLAHCGGAGGGGGGGGCCSGIAKTGN